LDAPKSFQELLQHAINILFALVLIQSFPLVTKIFVPLTNLYNLFYIVNAFAILFIYFFIITSWIGYFKSIQSQYHSENKSGLARFGIDIFIIYLYWYLVEKIEREIQPEQIANYSEIFIWILPIIVGAFVLWDSIKWLEHTPNSLPDRKHRRGRMIITWLFLSGIIFQSFIYYNINTHVIPPLKLGDVVIWDIPFFVFSFIMTYLYRRRKWLVKSVKE
jgi:hypothetical protein